MTCRRKRRRHTLLEPLEWGTSRTETSEKGSAENGVCSGSLNHSVVVHAQPIRLSPRRVSSSHESKTGGSGAGQRRGRRTGGGRRWHSRNSKVKFWIFIRGFCTAASCERQRKHLSWLRGDRAGVGRGAGGLSYYLGRRVFRHAARINSAIQAKCQWLIIGGCGCGGGGGGGGACLRV